MRVSNDALRIVAGGSAGRTARFLLAEASGHTRALASKSQALRLAKGDCIILETAGGGGWGEPAACDGPARGEDDGHGRAS